MVGFADRRGFSPPKEEYPKADHRPAVAVMAIGVYGGLELNASARIFACGVTGKG